MKTEAPRHSKEHAADTPREVRTGKAHWIHWAWRYCKWGPCRHSWGREVRVSEKKVQRNKENGHLWNRGYVRYSTYRSRGKLGL